MLLRLPSKLSFSAVSIFSRGLSYGSMSAYQTIKGDGIGGDGVTLTPTGGLYDRVVVWLHGLGDTAAGWTTVMPELRLERTKFVLPTAETMAVTVNRGYAMPAWYDVDTLEEDGNQDIEGLQKSKKRLSDIISNEIQNGTPASNIIVGGFSQGGVVASRYALVSDIKLGGCCVIGSWIPMWEEYPKSFGKATKSIPFWVGHGDSDNMVNHAVAKKCSDFVKSLGVDVNFCMYEHVGHHTCTKQINDVSKFIEQNTNHPPEYGEFLP